MMTTGDGEGEDWDVDRGGEFSFLIDGFCVKGEKWGYKNEIHEKRDGETERWRERERDRQRERERERQRQRERVI